MNYHSWLWTSALHKSISKNNLEILPDVWVLDLEDSVSTENKEAARKAAISWFQKPCVFRSKRTTISVCKRTANPVTSEQQFRYMRTALTRSRRDYLLSFCSL